MPPDAENVAVLRVVVREGFSRDMADLLLADLTEVVEGLKISPPRAPKKAEPGFHH
jgi:glutamate decarboxylase